MVNIADLKIDTLLEENGGWFVPPQWPGVRFHVRGTGSKAFTEAQRRTATSRAFENASEDEKYALNAGHICDHLLLGWEGFDVEFTPLKARDILLNPEYREVTTAVLWCAQQASTAPLNRRGQSGTPAAPAAPAEAPPAAEAA